MSPRLPRDRWRLRHGAPKPQARTVERLDTTVVLKRSSVGIRLYGGPGCDAGPPTTIGGVRCTPLSDRGEAPSDPDERQRASRAGGERAAWAPTHAPLDADQHP